jgi:CHASE3 domain sensor protein
LYSQALEQIEQEERARRQRLVRERSGADVRMLLIVLALVSLVVALWLSAFT